MSEYDDESNDYENKMNEQIGGSDNNKSFIDYITSFSATEKAQVMNLVQYCGIAVLPLLAVLKFMKIYMPISNPLKPTSELVFEVIVQLLVILVSFFFIHKLVLYFPTYSEVKYENFSLLSGMLPLLFLMFTLDTKISEKLNVLFDRLLSMVGLIKEPFDKEEGEGEGEGEEKDKKPKNVNGATQSHNMQTTSIEELSGLSPMSGGGLQGSGIETFDSGPYPANMF